MIRLAAMAGLLAAATGGAAAQSSPGGRAALPAPVAPTVVEDAQASFRAAVDAYAAGDVETALEEFERAYRLAPSYKILFNLAQVAYQRRDYVLATRYFTRYLSEGGDLVEPARRAEVERELARLRTHVGELEIVGADAGGDVFVDDVRVGVTPLAAPLAATVGRRRVEVVETSGRRQVRQVDVTAGGRLRVDFAWSSEASKRVAAQGSAGPLPSTRPVGLGAPHPAPAAMAPGAILRASEPATASTRSSSSWKPWVAWGLTALAATGALVAARRALAASNELQSELGNYPVTRQHLDGLRDQERRWALITDATSLATAILGATAIYLTTAPAPRPAPPTP